MAPACASALEEQRVPLEDHLVVESGPGSGGTRLGHPEPGVGDLVGAHQIVAVVDPIRDAPASERGVEVAVVGDVPVLECRVDDVGSGLGERGADLVGGPRVEQALHAIAIGVGRVGVLGREEPTLFVGERVEYVLDRVLDDEAPLRLAEDDEGVQVGLHEQRLIGEHLLEVGNEPLAVGRITGEAAAHVVVDAAGGHGIERRRDDGLGRLGSAGHVGPQDQLDVERRREFRSRAESTPFLVERSGQCLDRGVHLLDGRQIVGGGEVGRLLDRLHQRGRVLIELGGLVAIGVVDRIEQLEEVVARVVGAAVERLCVGGQEDRHRPPAAPGQGLDGVHVELVDVGAFLAVDLDVDVELVHPLGDLGVLEALVGHHVAPVARRVADRQQDRDVPLPGGGECLVAPRIPVDGVVTVLSQIRRRLFSQTVHPSEGTEMSSAGTVVA